jgi:hypothetical protein
MRTWLAVRNYRYRLRFNFVYKSLGRRDRHRKSSAVSRVGVIGKYCCSAETPDKNRAKRRSPPPGFIRRHEYSKKSGWLARRAWLAKTPLTKEKAVTTDGILGRDSGRCKCFGCC